MLTVKKIKIYQLGRVLLNNNFRTYIGRRYAVSAYVLHGWCASGTWISCASGTWISSDTNKTRIGVGIHTNVLY